MSFRVPLRCLSKWYASSQSWWSICSPSPRGCSRSAPTRSALEPACAPTSTVALHPCPRFVVSKFPFAVAVACQYYHFGSNSNFVTQSPITGQNNDIQSHSGLSDAENSISIRTFLLGSISNNISSVENVLESEDVISSINCLRKLGVKIIKKKIKKLFNLW